MALRGTAGQLLVNDALPEDMRDYRRVITKQSLAELLSQLAEKHPDKYRDISHKLANIGRNSAFTTGGFSFGVKHLLKPPQIMEEQNKLRERLSKLLDDDSIDDKKRQLLILKYAGELQARLPDLALQASKEADNPLAHQLMGAGRGNKVSLNSLIGGDMLYSDHKGEVVPIPVIKSYGEGLTPAEYWASTYGARQGIMAVKMGTADAGFLGKQLAQANHRLLVSDVDSEGDSPTLRGLPVDTDDDESEGSLLAADFGPYKRNTVITPKILQDLRRKKVNRILVRSPAVFGAPDGSLYARDVGIREYNRLPAKGEFVGITAAQALSEPIAQGSLNTKHGGGVAGQSKLIGGFDLINNLVQIPKTFKGGAVHATLDGIVQGIEQAPAGGQFIIVNNEKHYVANGFNPSVKKGDKVEAGDIMSDGIPNPRMIVKYKGIGEGRRYFTGLFKKAMNDSGMKAHRRNVELLSRGLIDHIKLNDEYENYAPDDVVPYHEFEAKYQPREGFKPTDIDSAEGLYLERPYLHYTIGTKVKPSVIKDLREFGIKQVDVHRDEPIFEPEMIRGMSNLQHDPEWMTRLLGSGLKKGLLSATHRGSTSDEAGTSFVPARAKAIGFGEIGRTITPNRFENEPNKV